MVFLISIEKLTKKMCHKNAEKVNLVIKIEFLQKQNLEQPIPDLYSWFVNTLFLRQLQCSVTSKVDVPRPENPIFYRGKK